MLNLGDGYLGLWMFKKKRVMKIKVKKKKTFKAKYRTACIEFHFVKINTEELQKQVWCLSFGTTMLFINIFYVRCSGKEHLLWFCYPIQNSRHAFWIGHIFLAIKCCLATLWKALCITLGKYSVIFWSNFPITYGIWPLFLSSFMHMIFTTADPELLKFEK